jgi:hypothetical protein
MQNNLGIKILLLFSALCLSGWVQLADSLFLSNKSDNLARVVHNDKDANPPPPPPPKQNKKK